MNPENSVCPAPFHSVRRRHGHVAQKSSARRVDVDESTKEVDDNRLMQEFTDMREKELAESILWIPRLGSA